MSDRKLTFVVAEDEERMRDYLARKIAELDSNLQCAGAPPTEKRPWSSSSGTCRTC